MANYISKIFLTVDVVVFKKNTSEVLLIKRLNNPFKNCWALPGGFVDENEDLEQAARRELFEETNVKAEKMEQIGAFGKPFRDPRGHMISIAYSAEFYDNQEIKAKDDAKDVAWFPISNLPELAFDHQEIISQYKKTIM